MLPLFIADAQVLPSIRLLCVVMRASFPYYRLTEESILPRQHEPSFSSKPMQLFAAAPARGTCQITIRLSNDFIPTANKLLLAAPKHSLKNQRPGKTKVGNEVNEHRYRQAA